VAVRVSLGGKTFAFSADTLPCNEIIACAKNADLFLCDALCAELDGEEAVARALSALHATAREAAAMASRAGDGALACTHIARFGNPVNILAGAKMLFANAVTVAHDGDRYRI
jgi:ribonuclease BN (tRNA processing enzyme)